MAEFILSAFSDEYSSVFDKQLEGLNKNNVKYMEIRGVDGKNISDITCAEAKEIKSKIDNAGIKISSIGSPIGKIKITDDIDAHIEKLKHIIELAKILDTDRIRMFSFYLPADEPFENYRSQVIDEIGRMLEAADETGITLCHENEKGIYGDIPSRCLDLMQTFDGKLGCVFDHANFIQCKAEPYPSGFDMLEKYITYMHIKDAEADGSITPAGEGIGRITETLGRLDKREGEIILTVEPHLKVFAGLAALEGGERTKLKNAFETSEEAFAAAIAGIRKCIDDCRK